MYGTNATQKYTTLTLYEVCFYFGHQGRIVHVSFIQHTLLGACEWEPTDFRSQLTSFHRPSYFASFPKIRTKSFKLPCECSWKNLEFFVDNILCKNINKLAQSTWVCARIAKKLNNSWKVPFWEGNFGRKGHFASLQLILCSLPANRHSEVQNQLGLPHQGK